MTDMTEQELAEIIAAGESDRVEFTERLSNTAFERLRKTVCAMANDLADHGKPGLVLIGVRDDRSLGDLQVDGKLLAQIDAMKTDGDILPPPSLAVAKHVIAGRQLALVSVQPSDSAPVRYRDVAYVRVGPTVGIATLEEEAVLKARRRYGNLPPDSRPVPSARLTDLDLTGVGSEDSSDATIAEDGDTPVPTLAGVLMYGREPRRFVPWSYVQLVEGEESGTGAKATRRISGASTEISGSIPQIVQQIDEQIDDRNRAHATFPPEALREVVRNAVMHRSYEVPRPIQVLWCDDRVEVRSPGGPWGAVDRQNFGAPGAVDYRNPTLAEAMARRGCGRRLGMGIALARERLKEAGHPELEFDVGRHHVRATIRAGRQRGRADPSNGG